MPSYKDSAYSTATLITSGVLFYGFGSAAGQPVSGGITNSVLTSNVVTLTLKVRAGDVPAVGDFISTMGVSNLNANANRATITAVSGFNTGDNSTGTVSYAQTHADIPTAPDGGEFIVERAEGTEAVANGASVPFVFQGQTLPASMDRSIKAVATFPSHGSLTTTKVTIQSALVDKDSEYSDVATIASFSGGVQAGGQTQVTFEAGRFYRFNVSTTAGTGTMIVKAIA